VNHWHPDLIVAERRLEDLRARAARERLGDLARQRGRPVSLRIHLDLQLTLGRTPRPEPQPR